MIYGNWVQWSEAEKLCFSLPHDFFLSLSLCLSSSSFSISPFPFLYWHLLPTSANFILNEAGGELYLCDCRGRWLIGGRPKSCSNALQMMDQLRIANDWGASLTFEVFYVLRNTMIASALYSLNCATSERKSIMRWFYFYFYNWNSTFRFGLQHITYPQITCIYNLLHWLFGYFQWTKKLFQFILRANLVQNLTLDASMPTTVCETSGFVL